MSSQLAQALNNPRAYGGGGAVILDLAQTSNQLIFHVGAFSVCTVQLVSDSTTAVVTLSRSNDASTPVALETAQTITGSGMSNVIDCSAFMYLHVRVTTVESAKIGGVIVCGAT